MALLTPKEKKHYKSSLQKKWLGGFIIGSFFTGLIVYNVVMSYALSIITK
jgi:hypothetical protein